MTLDLISRLIGAHCLVLLEFYPYMIRYLRPSQKEGNKMLAITCQSFHKLVPPDEAKMIVLHIASSFVSPASLGGTGVGSSGNVQRRNKKRGKSKNRSNMGSARYDICTAAGINAIREICARCPYAMSAELLSELGEYKRSEDKGVMMASRSLISLYRILNPGLLERKERGREVGQMIV